MKWISRIHETLGVEWEEKGWYFDKPKEDYGARLLCKKCGCTPRVDECKKDIVRGYRGDDCGAPVFYLHCTECYETLAVIDEGLSDYRPLLNFEKNGELIT